MRKNLLIGAIALSAIALEVSAFEINVAEPGTFRELMIDTEEDVSTLTISGTMNAADVEYLTGNTGKIAQVQHLVIGDLKLVESETEPYRSFTIFAEAGSGQSAKFYYSSDERTEWNSFSSGLGGVSVVYSIYGTDLAGLLAKTQFHKITLPEDATKVPDYMCFECFATEEVEMSDNVEEIGKQAFMHDTKLTSINYPSKLKMIGESAFEWTGLTSFVLPDHSVEILDGAFRISSLTSINLENVTSVGVDAFSGTGLKKVNLSGASVISQKAFQSCPITELIVSDKLRVIGEEAFANPYSGYGDDKFMTDLVLHEGLESIGANAFYDTHLKNVNIPSTVTYIGQDAFGRTPWDSSLNAEAIDGVVYLGNIAYKSVNRPENIVFREGTVSISANFNMEYTKSFTLPSSVRSIYASAGYYWNLESAVLNEGLQIIGDNCFSNSKNLTSITLPESLEEIGEGAFYYSGLTSLTLPEGLKRIGDYSMCGLQIPSVTLPEGLEYIGRYSFCDCNSLATVRFNCRDVEAGGYYDDGHGQYSVPGVFGSSVEKIIIGRDVERIPSGMFAWKNNLARIEFEDSDVPLVIGDLGIAGGYGNNTMVKGSIDRVTTIGTYGMENLAFPDGTDLGFPNLKSLGEAALNGISGARSISLSPRVESIGPDALAGATGLMTLRFDVPDVKKPESYKWDYALMPNVELDSIVIGRNVINIPESFFSNATCNTLVFEPRESTRASSSLSIGSTAFYHNRNLYCVDFPSDVVALGDRVFDECNQLSTVYFHSQEAPIMGTEAIYRTATVYVPAEAESEYKAMMPRNNVVPYQLETVVLDKSVLYLKPGESDYLIARISPAECSEMGLIWSSSDPSVATVNDRGDVVGVGFGQATVTAVIAFDETFRAECIVNVYDPDSVDSIDAENASPVEALFTLDGIRIEKPAATGIYIARHADGSVSKIMIK